MYIEPYWSRSIGGSDTSLTLVEYLAGKEQEDLPFGEVFSDFGLDQLDGDFRSPEIPLTYTNSAGWEIDIPYAIELLAGLAALLLECKISGSVDLRELFDGVEDAAVPVVRITAAPEEHALLNRTLADFVSEPLAYDLAEMCTEEELLDMAADCNAIREELYGPAKE